MGPLLVEPVSRVTSRSPTELFFNAIAKGRAEITGLLRGEDENKSTWACLEALGVSIEDRGDSVRVEGRAGKFSEPYRLLTGGIPVRPFG